MGTGQGLSHCPPPREPSPGSGSVPVASAQPSSQGHRAKRGLAPLCPALELPGRPVFLPSLLMVPGSLGYRKSCRGGPHPAPPLGWGFLSFASLTFTGPFRSGCSMAALRPPASGGTYKLVPRASCLWCGPRYWGQGMLSCCVPPQPGLSEPCIPELWRPSWPTSHVPHLHLGLQLKLTTASMPQVCTLLCLGYSPCLLLWGNHIYSICAVPPASNLVLHRMRT